MQQDTYVPLHVEMLPKFYFLLFSFAFFIQGTPTATPSAVSPPPFTCSSRRRCCLSAQLTLLTPSLTAIRREVPPQMTPQLAVAPRRTLLLTAIPREVPPQVTPLMVLALHGTPLLTAIPREIPPWTTTCAGGILCVHRLARRLTKMKSCGFGRARRRPAPSCGAFRTTRTSCSATRISRALLHFALAFRLMCCSVQERWNATATAHTTPASATRTRRGDGGARATRRRDGTAGVAVG